MMRGISRRTMAMALAIAAAGCGSPTSDSATTQAALLQEVGRECSVFFRHDAHGTTAGAGGPTIVLSGTLKEIRGDWIRLEVGTVIRDGGGGPPQPFVRDYRIPTSSILYVELR